MTEVILDVREKDEFNAEHIPGSIHVPLSALGSRAPGVLNELNQHKLIIMCRSGNRARMAQEQLNQLGYSDKITLSVYNGGIQEWKRQGNPVITRKADHLPLMRQVQLGAGSMVLIGTILGAFVNPAFLGISAFVGAGLTVAGATGFCGLAELLSRMPWNRTENATSEELCQVSPGSPSCNN